MSSQPQKPYTMMYFCNKNGQQSGPIEIIKFPTEAMGKKWQFAVELIKSTIASINDDLAIDGRLGRGTIEDYGTWLKLVSQFIEEFGKKNVPSDIQHALNSVEKGLGLPVTTWSARNYVK